MAAIRVKPIEHRVQVQPFAPSRIEIAKKAKRNLFGSPNPGETDEILRKEQANYIEKLSNYVPVGVKFDVDFNSESRSNEDRLRPIKRVGSLLMTDHFRATKKVCKPTNKQSTLVTTKEKLIDVAEQSTTEFSEIGSTNFVTNFAAAASDSTLEAAVICPHESLPTPTHQQHEIEEQSQNEIVLHIMMTNPAGKFS